MLYTVYINDCLEFDVNKEQYDMNEIRNFGQRISEYRKNKNITQEEMAIRLGVTPQALLKWERGQSLPDVALLADICQALDVSSDYLLGVQNQRFTENSDESAQNEILNNLNKSLEPLELALGTKLVSIFIDNSFVGKMIDMRKNLSREGILMPLVRIQDYVQFDEMEFMVLASHNVLYAEKLDEITDDTLDHIMQMFYETVKKRYADIITPDIMKSLVDNMRRKYPAIIDGIVPEKISYAVLTEVARNILKRGDSIVYLPKIIEYLESALRNNPVASVEELSQSVAERLECKDNMWIVLGKRKQ
ncbi:MAG: FHIPEP family type III secretion protein [Lachnospiraceae bacterium]|nr:FHIPEP family type III secretion protein [Lachnospiraceae bacterium]